MADKEISELTAAEPLDGSELVHVVQGGNSRQVPVSSLGGGGSGGGGAPSYVSAIGWRVRTLAAGSGGSDLAAWGEVELQDATATRLDHTGGFATDSATEAGFDGAEAFDEIVAAGNGFKHQELAGSAVDSFVGYIYDGTRAPRYLILTPIPAEEAQAPVQFAVDYTHDEGTWTTLTTRATTWLTDAPKTFDLYEGAAYVQKSGDTMTGPLMLAGDPTEDLEAANKQYVDDEIADAVAGLLDYKGGTDCSANPNYPAALKGDSYVVTVAGKIGGGSGPSVEIGDFFFAKADNAGGTHASVGGDWDILQYNLTSGTGNPLTDGDKGDVTVSASGATFTIDNDAVTYAKMQNVSATDKLLGRSTSGAGDVEEITCTAAARSLLDDTTIPAMQATLKFVTLADQAAYDALSPPDADTYYFVPE